jgi:hypothetical protein
MGEIEPFHRISGDENTPAIDALTAAGDFHSANKRRRTDLAPRRRTGEEPSVDADEVVLSDVANVSLLEEEGMSVSAIAADLGLTPEMVLADISIASKICRPTGSAPQVGHRRALNAA